VALCVVKALLLDALGTLVALDPPAPRLAPVLGIPEADAERAIAAEMSYYRAHLNDGRDAESLVALRRRCAEVLSDALPSHARRGDLVEVLMASLRFSAFPDAAPALEALRGRGVRLIVVSNWDCSLPDVLARVGLAPLLDGVVVSAVVGERKPSPAIFEHALSVAGAPAESAVHVGDNVVEDVEGARAAGIEAVLVRRDGRAGPPGVRTIASLEELEGWL
jgi:putative hydrolase of the HAD superfamily